MWLGIDLGSVSTDLALIDSKNRVIASSYILTAGRPVRAIKKGLAEIKKQIPDNLEIKGVGTTGSGRKLAGILVNADAIKNEITCHAISALLLVPNVQTVIEIGGQDSKFIAIRNGVPVDFAMNTICAAGTGSFLDHQAQRLGISIEELAKLGLKSKNPVRIAGRCTVFAESDMIHKHQVGYKVEDIIAGLCKALVRNYLNNVAKSKEILPPVVFQGGVAANESIRKAFEEELGMEVIVPEHHKIMGAIGAAVMAREILLLNGNKTNFKGFGVINTDFDTKGFNCEDCSNNCEIVELYENGKMIASWGSRCGKWNT